MRQDITDLCVSSQTSLREVILCINRIKTGIALVVDAKRHLLGVITDGDIRRAILAGLDLTVLVQVLLDRKKRVPKPITASITTPQHDLIKLFQETHVSHIPLLDDQERVAGVVGLDDLLPDVALPLQAVVMAGGYGSRLSPLTETLPKPMLPVGDRPLMELIIQQLRRAGIRHVNISTHYMSEKIIEYFGDGHDFGVELNYVTENRPLGTVGALGLMAPPQEPLLVINGDILTQVDFRAMLAYHQEHQAAMTIGTRKYDLNVPYGVIESDGAFVRGLVEKPTLKFFVNAGIYLLEPSIHQYIPNNQRFDMTDLIQRLLDEGQPVVSFPILEYWLDIGHHADYTQAQEDMKNGSFDP